MNYDIIKFRNQGIIQNHFLHKKKKQQEKQ